MIKSDRSNNSLPDINDGGDSLVIKIKDEMKANNDLRDAARDLKTKKRSRVN